MRPSSRARMKMLGGLVLAGLGVGLGLLGCASPPAESAATDPGREPAADVGSASFALTIGGGFQFDQVTYDISGNGFHRAATLDVSTSATFSTLVSGIPFGAGYTAALTANDVAHKLMSCRGSATFDVASTATVPVTVAMTCHQVHSTTPPPPAVPVPRGAIYGLAALLLTLGATRLRRAPGA